MIQSVLFERSHWTTIRARSWLKAHNLKHSKVDKTEKYIRFRQIDPDKARKQGYTRFRSKFLPAKITVIYALSPN